MSWDPQRVSDGDLHESLRKHSELDKYACLSVNVMLHIAHKKVEKAQCV